MKISLTVRRDNTLTTVSWDSNRPKVRNNRPYEVGSTDGWMVKTQTRQLGRVAVQHTRRNPEALKTRASWATPSHFDSSYALKHGPYVL